MSERSKGACDKPKSMPQNKAYDDGYDRIFKKIKDPKYAEEFLKRADILNEKGELKKEYGGTG